MNLPEFGGARDFDQAAAVTSILFHLREERRQEQHRHPLVKTLLEMNFRPKMGQHIDLKHKKYGSLALQRP